MELGPSDIKSLVFSLYNSLASLSQADVGQASDPACKARLCPQRALKASLLPRWLLRTLQGGGPLSASLSLARCRRCWANKSECLRADTVPLCPRTVTMPTASDCGAQGKGLRGRQSFLLETQVSPYLQSAWDSDQDRSWG